jgi:hypothetical protein
MGSHGLDDRTIDWEDETINTGFQNNMVGCEDEIDSDEDEDETIDINMMSEAFDLVSFLVKF